MPELQFNVTAGGSWAAVVKIPYSLSYNRAANTTTVDFDTASIAYVGRNHYGTSSSFEISVQGNDSSEATTCSISTYGTTTGGVSTFYATPQPSSVVVQHSGSGEKSVTIGASGYVKVYIGSSSEQSTIYGNGSVDETSGSRYSLSLQSNEGITLSVTRDGIDLANGALLSKDEVLSISFSVSQYYNLQQHTLNGLDISTGDSHTVAGDVVIVVIASAKSYTLNLIPDANSIIQVNRTSSPVGGAAQGYLSNGAILYAQDRLSISCYAKTGYTILTKTINGVDLDESQVVVVDQNEQIVVTAAVSQYLLSRDIPEYINLSITRVSSPIGGGNTGIMPDSDNTLYYGDILRIAASPRAGYFLSYMRINGSNVPNPTELTVSSSITVSADGEITGFVSIDSGSYIEKYRILIDSGSSMEQYRAMIDTGSAIVPY